MGLYVAPKLLFSKIIPDKGFYDFKGKSIRNVNKFTCKDYFGAFIPTESDTVRFSKIFDPALTASGVLTHLYDSFSHTIPSIYAAGKVRVKVTASCSYAHGAYPAALYIKKISTTGIESDILIIRSISPFSGVYPVDISVSGGDKLMLMSIGTYSITNFTISQIDVCADETELALNNTGFDWDEWQD